MLGHWYTLLLPRKEPPKSIGSHGIEKQPPQAAYQVDRFSDFVRTPKVRRNDDDEFTIIFMMQGA